MQDILLDDNDDLWIENGDFVVGEANYEQIKSILMANKGDWKEFPELGVAIEDMLNDDEITGYLIDAKKNLEYDGVKVNNISFTENGSLSVDGNYKE